MRSLKYAVVLAIGLTGCNSFNTYEPPHGPRGRSEIQQDNQKKKEDKGFFSFLFGGSDDQQASDAEVAQPASTAIVIAIQDERGNYLCPVAKLNVTPPPPEVPVDQLRQLAPTDKDAIIQLLTNHIDEMHKYATNVRNREEQQRKRYAAECRKWLILHQQ